MAQVLSKLSKPSEMKHCQPLLAHAGLCAQQRPWMGNISMQRLTEQISTRNTCLWLDALHERCG